MLHDITLKFNTRPMYFGFVNSFKRCFFAMPIRAKAPYPVFNLTHTQFSLTPVRHPSRPIGLPV